MKHRCRFSMIDKSLNFEIKCPGQIANPSVNALEIDADRIPDEKLRNSFRKERSAIAISYAAHADAAAADNVSIGTTA